MANPFRPGTGTATTLPLRRSKKCFALAAILVTFGLSALRLQAAVLDATPTFDSIGIYWSPGGGSATDNVSVRYRKLGATVWNDGAPLWFDDNDGEYRGSLVHLAPGTIYQIELDMQDGPTELFQTTTWSEEFPVGQIVELPETSSSTLNVNQSGTPDGYVLYTHAPGSTATIDVLGSGKCISIRASYVIIRDLVLRGAQSHCIYVQSGVSDIVIENNDISGWGSSNYDAAIRAWGGGVERLVIQRNLIHDPRQDTSSWCEAADFTCNVDCGMHPVGPHGIRIKATDGNHVIRYNTITTTNNWLHDGIGLGATPAGVNDVDVYGNRLEYIWDNAIEAESEDRNTRIWGNFMDHTYSPLALVPVLDGPIYAWRNVFGYNNRKGPENCTGDTDSDPRGRAFKAGYVYAGGGGQTYLYHNTVLHEPASGMNDPLGVNDGILTSASSGSADNIVSRNNIIFARGQAMQEGGGNDYDHDLYQGSIPTGAEPNGIPGIAVYDSGNGTDEYFLDPASPGQDAGVALPGFNDGYDGAAPEMGAYETGAASLEFGVNAYTSSNCGNGIVDVGEMCDGTNLDDAGCRSLGFASGTLACDGCAFDTGSCNADTTPPSTPQGLSAVATGQTGVDLSWAVASDPETGISGYVVYRDGVPVGRSLSTSFSDTGLADGTAYTYEVSAQNGAGLESSESSPATESTVPDATSPSLVSVSGLGTTVVQVIFSEPVETTTAQTAANYAIDNGVTVWMATLAPDRITVTLITSPLTAGSTFTHTLTVNNVLDLATVPNAIAPDSDWTFEYVVISTLEIGPGDEPSTIHELSWETVENALTFDLVRGDLRLLRSGAGDFVSSTESCVATGLEQPSFIYAGSPPPGEAWFLLLRPVTSAGPGSYDSSGLEQTTGRDLPIKDSGADCP